MTEKKALLQGADARESRAWTVEVFDASKARVFDSGSTMGHQVAQSRLHTGLVALPSLPIVLAKNNLSRCLLARSVVLF